jgi:hypothetical protein
MPPDVPRPFLTPEQIDHIVAEIQRPSDTGLDRPEWAAYHDDPEVRAIVAALNAGSDDDVLGNADLRTKAHRLLEILADRHFPHGPRPDRVFP